MLKHDYWLFEFLPISRIFLNGPTKYAMAYLQSETDGGDLTYFVDYNLKVICRAIKEFLEYLEEQQAKVSQAISLVVANPQLNRRQAELLIHSLKHPGYAYTISMYRKINGISNGTARSDLKLLCDIGLLEKIKSGKAHLYIPPKNLAKKMLRLERGEARILEPNETIIKAKNELKQLSLFDL